MSYSSAVWIDNPTPEHFSGLSSFRPGGLAQVRPEVQSGTVKSSRPLADPKLTSLLAELLSEELLPPLDRWFSARAKRAGWPAADQKRLWDALRRALTRAYALIGPAAVPAQTSWAGMRTILRGRSQEWALRADLPAGEPSLAAAGIPGWLSPAFEARRRHSGWTAGQAARFLALQETAAPVHVRFQASPEGEACRRRLAEGGQIEPSEVEGIFSLSGGRGLEAGADWKHGLVEIQDAASQLSLNRLGLRPGMRVWDLCAGQGGKTLLAARELRGKGTLVASDVAEAKLKTLKERVRRSGWQNIRLLGWDGSRLPDFGAEIRGPGGFDRVIVDAPCSASGTWRRDPEGRFRLTPAVLRELAKHQHRLIRLGWEGLKAGGRLAYITCSWLPAENEEVVVAFTEETGARCLHQELLGLPAFDANTLFVSILEKP